MEEVLGLVAEFALGLIQGFFEIAFDLLMFDWPFRASPSTCRGQAEAEREVKTEVNDVAAP